MRGQWPHDDVVADLLMVMGATQGNERTPYQRLTDASYLYNAITVRLGLPRNSDRVDYELTSALLKAVLDEFEDDSSIRASAELLGYTKRSAEELDSIASRTDTPLKQSVRDLGYKSKVFRLYLASMHQAEGGLTPGGARPYQEKSWAPAMSKAIRQFLDDHREAALCIAARFGYSASVDSPRIETGDVLGDRQSSDEQSSSGNVPSLRPRAGAATARPWRSMMRYWNKPYARRNDLHDQIKRSVAENCRIALFGLPGFGKTHLASAVAVEMADEMNGEAIYLVGDSLNSLIKGVRQQLNIRNKTVALDEERLMRDFADLIDTSNPPLVVVIDDVKDPELPERVLPPFLGTPVIVTMRERVVDQTVWECIPVQKLSVDEAMLLGQAELSDLFSDDEIERLITVLEGYPLAITSASALFHQGSYLSLDKFCTYLERDIARVFDVKEKRTITLTFIYKSLLEHLETENLQTVQLLAAQVALRRNVAPRPALQGIFESVPSAIDSSRAYTYDAIGFMTAIKKLEDYSFVSSISADDDVAIHQLVRELVAKLVLDRHPGISLAAAIWLHGCVNNEGVDAREIQDWAVSISAVINDIEFHRLSSEYGDLLTDLVVTSACAVAGQGGSPELDALRNNWVFSRLIAGSGKVDGRIAYLLHKLLKFTDAEDDRLILVNLSAPQYISSSMTDGRKMAIEAHTWGTNAVDRQTLGFSSRASSSSVLVESIPDPVVMGYDAMRNGDTAAAHAHATRPLQEGDSREKRRAHALLTRIAMRRLNLPAAAQHLQDLKASHLFYGFGAFPLIDFLAGELAYVEFAISNNLLLVDRVAVEEPISLLEKAKAGYAREVIPVGQAEVERRLGCLEVHRNTANAMVRLERLSDQTKVPVMLPVHFRTAVSIMKVAIVGNTVKSRYVDNCWRAAEFFSTSPAFDRYWYAEALLTILLRSSLKKPTLADLTHEVFPDLAAAALGKGSHPRTEPWLDTDLGTPLGIAVMRELKAIDRLDKLEILKSAKRGTLDVRRLLID